jgi:hypothetical protein
MTADLLALERLGLGDRIVYTDGADESVVGTVYGGLLLKTPETGDAGNLFLNHSGHTCLTVRLDPAAQEPPDWGDWLLQALDRIDGARPTVKAAINACEKATQREGEVELPIARLDLTGGSNGHARWEVSPHRLTTASTVEADIDHVYKRARKFVVSLGERRKEYKTFRQEPLERSGFNVIRLLKPGQAAAPVFIYGPRQRDEAVLNRIIRATRYPTV